MHLRSEKVMKIELTRTRRRQNPHVFDEKEYKRKLRLRRILWKNKERTHKTAPSS